MNSSDQLQLKYIWGNKLLVAFTVIFGISGSIFNGIGTTLIIPTVLIILGQEDSVREVKVFEIIITYLEQYPETIKILIMVSMVFLSVLIKNITNLLSNLASFKLNQNISKQILTTALRNLCKVSIDYYNQNQIGTIISDNTGEIFRTSGAIQFKVKLIINVVSIFSYIWVLLSISWQLTIFTSILLGITGGLNQLIVRRSKFYGVKLTEKIKEYSNTFIEFLMGIRLIKIFNTEMEEYEKIKHIYEERESLQFQSQVFSSVISPINETLGVLIILSLIVVGKYLFFSQFQSISSLVLVYLAILFRLIPYFNQLNTLRSQLAQNEASVQRVVNLLSRENKLFLKNGSKQYQGIQTELYFESVKFVYPSHQRLVLDNISFSIPKGKTTALVGTSGAGKSTIADLIIRLYDPTAGKITIDGIDLREFDLTSLHKHIGVVSQDTFLFNNTVTYNLSYGIKDVSEAEIISAAKDANAYEFIMQLPQGFNTKIGDRGVLLSGGQKQRIAIARALLRNPDILIFDEATSALDTVSEKVVQEAVERLAKDRTTIIIAHRLSTIKKAEQIIVLEKGKVIEVGSHQQLLKTSGKYSQLYQTQFADLEKEKRSITADLSHQARNRLNSLLGSLRLLADGLVDSSEDKQQLIEESYQSAVKLFSIIELHEDKNQSKTL